MDLDTISRDFVPLAQLGRLLPAPAGTVAVIDIGLAHPRVQGHLMDAKSFAICARVTPS